MINTDLGNLFSGTAKALWLLGKEKDSAAWSMIVKMHSSGMLHAAKGVLGDHFLAEDAVQNAFLQIRDLSAEYFRRENDKSSLGILGHQKENTIFKNDFAARNWIIRITYFVAKDMRKSRIASKDREKVYTQNWLEERKNESGNNQEVLLMLQGEIEKLPDELRLPIVLRFHCDMNFNQVSSELGLAVHVIRQRVQKGIEVLQSKLSAIIGSSMTVIGVESLLKNVYLLNESVADSLFRNCTELLDKPALTKSQLLLENKLLLQSSNFMVKGLVMLKVFVVLLVLMGTATIVVNSISSNEVNGIKKENQNTHLVEENATNNKISNKAELSKTDKSSEPVGNEKNNLAGENAKIVEAQSANGSPVADTKNNNFDINEILPYFSDKAIFTIILPDVSGSANRFSSSIVSKFYADPSVNLFGKFPLILKSKFNIDIQPFTGEMIKVIFEKTIDTFHCLGAQYSEDLNAKTHSFFIVGLLKKEEEPKFELLLQALKPFQKESKKNKLGFDVITYQFSKDKAKYELIKKQNKIIFGNADGIWVNNLENIIIADSFKKESFKADLYWKINLLSTFEMRYNEEPESIPQDVRIIKEILKNEFKENIVGELYILNSKITHKVSIPMKRSHQYSANEILVTKNITSEMLKQIPMDRNAFVCLNIDLQKSWAKYNGFIEHFFTQAIAIGGERFEKIKGDYAEEFGKIDEMCQGIFQMNLDSLMEKCLTGEIVCWVASNPMPLQTIKVGIKDPECALKMIKGLEAIWGKNSGVQISLNGKYISIVLPVSKDLMNQDVQKSMEEKSSYSLTESGILNKNFVSWSETSFSANHSMRLLLFNLFSQSQKVKNEDAPDDKDSLRLFLDSVKSNSTSFSLNNNGLNLEFENLDDMVQLLIGSSLFDKQFKVQNDSKAVYTQKEGIFYINNNPQSYIESKGYLLNGQKTGHWIFYNFKSEVIGEGEFRNDKETGFWKKTDWMGNIGEGEMVDGFQTGQWKIIDRFWKSPSYGEMKLGKKVGVWKSYHNKNKKLAEEGEYVDDKKVGVWYHYHDNGAKEFEENYKDGLLEGERTTWDEQGNITSTGTYKKGQLNGLRKEFVNQKLVAEEEAEDGNKTWSKTYFNENSNIKSEYHFDKIKAMEFFKEYHLNGQLKLSKQNIVLMKNGKREYKNPIPTGEWQEWHENNTKKMVGVFDNEGTGQKTYFYENGIKCAEYYFEKGLHMGKAAGWYDNGNPFFLGYYQKDLVDKQWTFWYVDGKKKAEGEFSAGSISSNWKFWDKKGELIEELKYEKIDVILDKKKSREYEMKLRNLVKEFSYFNRPSHAFSIVDDMSWIKKDNSEEVK